MGDYLIDNTGRFLFFDRLFGMENALRDDSCPLMGCFGVFVSSVPFVRFKGE